MSAANHTRRSAGIRAWRSTALIGFAAAALLLALASAAAAAPALKVTAVTPDHVTAGKEMPIWLNVLNAGVVPLQGTLTVKTTLPDGIPPEAWRNDSGNMPDPQCQVTGQETECTVDVSGIVPGVQMRLRTDPTVDSGASGALTGGQIEVSGAGAPGSFVRPLPLEAGPLGPFALKTFNVAMRPTRTAVSPTQAGADPVELATRFEPFSEAKTTFDFPIEETHATNVIAPAENLRDVIAHVPAGLIGNPNATPLRCTAAQLTNPFIAANGTGAGVPACPPESQVGLAEINSGDLVGLYNLVPPSGSPAAFGFFYNGVVVKLLARVRPSDNGIDVVTEQAANSIPLPAVEVSFWGVPSDRSHDPLRHICILGGHGYSSAQGDCSLKTRSEKPFLRTPTSCPGTALPWSIEMDTYQHVGAFVGKSTTTGATEGCDKLPFDPAISLTPSERAAHSPSGLDVNLTLPQENSSDGLAEADLRAATVTLPEGVSISPGSADGLAACSDAQLRLGLEGPSECPDAAKIGSVEVTTPLLDQPLGGSVFLRSQASSDPESGNLYRLAIELRSDRYGLAIKLPGSLVVNKTTGQITGTFDNLPQLPFEAMQLHFKTGPRAPLSTPSTCGTYSSHAVLTSWSGKTVALDSPFSVDRGCAAAPFAPGFQAGVAGSTAGEFSPFSLRVTRAEGQPNLSRIDATLPEGELAKLAGVPVCSDAQAAAGCPASSRIGSVVAGLGEGSSPLYLPQPGKAPTAVYLAGPYKGAPYSVIASVPAQAGPFDLGTVTVRSALRVDPETTRASVLSDPLPQIYGGIPVSYRDIRVNVDRPRFTVNPTSCEPKAVTGTIAAASGQSADVSDRFQVADCAALGFKPELALALKGATRRGANPALTATLRMPKGANIARASVALPHSAFLDQSHIRTICTRVQFAADGGGGAGCPAASVYGRARAFTPLLDQPLEGPVYLRSSNHNLPDLVASLDGAIHVDLAGRIDSFRGGIRTSFEAVPDAPVSKFVLAMRGGKKGLIQNSRDLCLGDSRADARFNGQNGKVRDLRPAVVNPRCGKPKRKAHRRRR